jgi:flagellar hook-associated protein 3 FlgL
MIGQGLEVSLHADGSQTFSNIFEQLSRLQQALQELNPSDATTAEVAAVVEPLNNAANQMAQIRAEGSVQFQWLESFANQYAQLNLRIEEMRSATEDADMTQAVVELQSVETAYETALAAAARILQPTLLQFLQ